MFTKLQTFLASFFIAAILFTGCRKAANELDFAVESVNHSDDQTIVSNEVDGLANDFNGIVDGYTSFNGRESNVTLLPTPCDATWVIDTASNPRKITITYNGSTCNPFRTRTGTVIVTLPSNMRWKDAGAILTVTIQNLKITRTSDGKSITINGTKTIKNVTGGVLRNLATLGTITHEISSTGMTLTFDDGSQRSWQVAKKRVFTYANGIVVSTSGNTTVDGISGVSEWGTNRYGNPFSTAIVSPMTIRQDCNFRLTSGEIKHYKMAATISVTFGLDSLGNATSCPGLRPYYFKAVYIASNGITRSVIRPYY